MGEGVEWAHPIFNTPQITYGQGRIQKFAPPLLYLHIPFHPLLFLLLRSRTPLNQLGGPVERCKLENEFGAL